MLDTSGAVVVKYEYDAWGSCKVFDAQGNDITYKENDETRAVYKNELGNLNPFRYRGYYYDVETGLYFLKTRYYDPETGRFINADSIAFLSAAFINGTNLYAYCCNNPVMFYDPMGTGRIKNFFKKLGKVILGAVLYAVGASLAVSTLPLALIPGGGFITQAGVSLAAYGGFMAASAFDDTINADMQAIGWNPFNTNEIAVVESEKVSFYKGVPVIRINGFEGSSGTFLGIFLNRDVYDGETLQHEWGHTIQQGIIGPLRFGITIAITSPSKLGERKWPSKKYRYRDRPWEITADIFGGSSNLHSKEDIRAGWWYLAAALLFPLASYLFLI